jgi:glycosyltransferase involved in cell wall biosynthesis
MISIITPVYNGDRFIENCIKNVISQNCQDVEHIIVDGGSTDRTIDIIKQYAEQYPHIRWLSEKDKGQSDAMNKGITMAKGEIISFLNADDYYEPNVLNRALAIFADLPIPSLLVGNCNVWDGKDNLIKVYKPCNFSLQSILEQGLNEHTFPTNPSAYFYHTCLHKQVGLYNVDEHYAMDLDFLLRAVQVGTVKYVDETWGNWMKVEGTKTVTLWQNRQQGAKVVNTILKTYRQKLPFAQRWKTEIKYNLFFLYLNIKNRSKYYLRDPRNIIKTFQKKLSLNNG